MFCIKQEKQVRYWAFFSKQNTDRVTIGEYMKKRHSHSLEMCSILVNILKSFISKRDGYVSNKI